MSSLGGPSIVTSGLVLHLDAANVKSLQDITTNLHLYSQNYVASPYIFGAILSTSTGYLAPDGSYTACLMIEDTTNSIHRWFVYPPITLSSNTLYTFSIYVKSAGRTKGVWFNEWTSGRVGVLYDLTLGTISAYTTSTGVLTSSTITNVGNGWYRISYTCQDSASLAGTIYDLRLVDNTGLLTYAGDGVSGVYFWGGQLEANSYPTTYLPTSGAIASRNICYDRSGNGNTGTLVNGPTYNSLKGGSISFDGVNDYLPVPTLANTAFPQDTGTVAIWYNIDSSASAGSGPPIFDGYDNTRNHIFIRRDYNPPNTLQVTCVSTTGSGTYVFNTNQIITLDTWHNIVVTYVTGVSSSVKVYIDGVLANSGTISDSAWRPTGQFVGFGSIYNTNTTKGKGGIIQVYNRALSATEVLQNYNATKSRFI